MLSTSSGNGGGGNRKSPSASTQVKRRCVCVCDGETPSALITWLYLSHCAFEAPRYDEEDNSREVGMM